MASTMTSQFTSENGYMLLIEGLLDILKEINGVGVTGEFIYMNFYQQGEQVGKELETEKDPQTALKEFIEYIRAYFDIEIISESSTKNKYKSDIQFNNCLIKKVCKNQGLDLKNPLCRSTQGFIEGVLFSMTGKKVHLDIHTPGWDICKGTIEFKKK